MSTSVQQGDWIWSLPHQAAGLVVDVEELWGQQRYRIWMPSLNTVLLHRPEELSSGSTEGTGDSGGNPFKPRTPGFVFGSARVAPASFNTFPLE